MPGFELLAQTLEESPTLSAVLAGPELCLVLQNRLSRELLGPRPIGAPLAEVFPETASSADEMRRVMLTGETWQDERRVGVRDVDGQELVLRFVVSPVGEGPPYPMVLTTSVDVTGTVRAREQARRAELLARLTQAMTVAPDPDAALQALADALVPAVARVAAVYVTLGDAPGERRGRGSGRHRDRPVRPPAARAAAATGPAGRTDARGTRRSAPADRVIIDLQGADRDAVDAPSRAWLERAGSRTIAVLPLVVAGDFAGALVLTDTGEAFTPGAGAVPRGPRGPCGRGGGARAQRAGAVAGRARPAARAAAERPARHAGGRRRHPVRGGQPRGGRRRATGSTSPTSARAGSAWAWATCRAAGCPPPR